MPHRLEVFDPALCCSSGVCGPSPDPVLPRFAADLDWVRRQGVEVARHNLSQDPGAFARSAVVREALEQGGVESLPLVLVDGRLLSKGRYPDRAALGAAAGLATVASAPPSRELDLELLALDLETCDRCTGTDASLDAAVAEAADELRARGVEVRLRKTVVTSVEQAEAARFATSPTIRIDGRDIALERRESACVPCGSLAGAPIDCRVWVYRGREHPVAPKEMIVEAVLAAAGSPSSAEAAATAPAFVLPDSIRRFLAGRASAGAATGDAPCCAPVAGGAKPRVPKGRCC